MKLSFHPATLATLILSAAPAFGLNVGGRLQLANGTPVAGPASLSIEQVGGEFGPWPATAAADGTWSASDVLLFGNLRITGTLTGHTVTPLEVFVSGNRNDLNITCVTLTPATTLPPVIAPAGTTMRGVVGPLTQTRSVAFQWGFTTDYGNTTPPQAAGTSAANLFPSFLLSPVQVPPGRTVHYRLKLGPGSSAPAPPDTFGADQSFTQPLALVEAPPVSGLTPVKDSRVALADFDGDGQMDILFAGSRENGQPLVSVVRKKPASSIIQILEPVMGAAFAVTDADRDGLPDVLLTGGFAGDNAAGQILKYYNSAPSNPGILPDRTNTTILGATGTENFLGTVGGAAAWIDFLSLGKPGFVLTGRRGQASVGESWISSGGVFQLQIGPYPACTASLVLPGHIDNDGRTDLLISGNNSGARSVTLQRNDSAEGGSFSLMPTGDIPAVDFGDAAWADSDADGDMDLVMTGASDTGPRTVLLLNDGTGKFTDAAAGFTPLFSSSVAWGDVDADGDPDLVTLGNTGFPSNTITTILYLNQGGNVFTPIATALPALSRGQAAWGRWDADSRLDLVLTGERPDGSPYLGMWTNPHTSINLPPSPPPAASLSVTGTFAGDGAALTFQWGRGADSTTPATALTYNIRIGTSPGAGDMWSGNSTADGLHPLTSGHGLMQSQLRLPTAILRPGVTYYWAVQSVDAGYATSPWVQGTPVTYGLASQTAVPVSPTTMTLTFAMPLGMSSGEFAVEYFLSGHPGDKITTAFTAFNTAPGQPAILSQQISGLEPGRVYFWNVVLRSGQNVMTGPLERLTTPIVPELVSLRLDEGPTPVLRFRASEAPAPVVEISSDMVHWVNAGSGTFLGSNDYRFVTSPFAATKRTFYRVRVGPQTSGE